MIDSNLWPFGGIIRKNSVIIRVFWLLTIKESFDQLHCIHYAQLTGSIIHTFQSRLSIFLCHLKTCKIETFDGRFITISLTQNPTLPTLLSNDSPTLLSDDLNLDIVGNNGWNSGVCNIKQRGERWVRDLLGCFLFPNWYNAEN